MCDECFKKEVETDEEERKHQCGNSACFCNEEFAYFLIDVLSQESALVFTPPMGYLLVKPFKIPECPICQDEYLNEIEEKKSFALQCGHIICTECCLKTCQSYSDEYQINCPTCEKTSDTYPAVNKQKDRFHGR